MNILMVSSYLPYPLFSGGHIRLYNLIKELSKKHAITLVCEKRDYQTEKDLEEVYKFCKKIITIPRKKQWTIENIIKTGFSAFPFLMVGHALPKMTDEIEKELKNGKYDILHVETFYVMQNLPATDLPVVLGEQNIEYLVYRRFTDNALFFLKHLFYLDVLKIRQWEQIFWRKADWVIATSENERSKIGKFNPHASVVPNGVDLSKFRGKGKGERGNREKRILFIGNFRWIENRDAVQWLVTSIWPYLKQKLKEKNLKAKLWIVGKEIPQTLKLLARDEEVIFDESAPDDTNLIYEKADILLAPIRVGSGTKFKILESMASGVPVVTTSIGVEGFIAKNGYEIMVEDSVEGLIKACVKLLLDKKLYEKIAQNGRTLIEKKYDWKKIVIELERTYSSVLKDNTI